MRPGSDILLQPGNHLNHMTCVSGTNSAACWTPRNESALQSRCSNGLISEAIIVNTSQEEFAAQWRGGWRRTRSGCIMAHL